MTFGLDMAVDVITVAIAVFVLRSGVRLAAQPGLLRSRFGLSGDVGDAATHLLLVDMIRRNRHRPVRSTPAFLMSGVQDYPVLFHQIMSFVPRRTLDRFEWVSSPAWEALHAAFVYVFARWWIEVVGGGQDTRLLALTVAVAWVLTPLLTRDVRRSAYLNERVFGLLAAHVFFILILASMETGSWATVAGALLAGAVIGLSSKFGSQTLLFVTPLWSLLMWSWIPIACLAGAAALAVTISGGHALVVWRGTWRHSRFYARHLVKVHDYTTSFSFETLMAAMRNLLQGRIRTGLSGLWAHPLAKVLLDAPQVWLALFVAVFGAPLRPIEVAVIAFALAAAFVAVLTTTDALKYLGEGERYLEVALLAPLLFLVLVRDHGLMIVGALIAYGLLRQLSTWRLNARTRARTSDTFEQLVGWLRAQGAMTLVTVPGRLAYPIAYLAPQHRFIWWFINAPERALEERWRDLFVGAHYPFPAPVRVAAAREQYGAEYVLLDRKQAEACRVSWGLNYDGVGGEVLFENATYRVCRAG